MQYMILIAGVLFPCAALAQQFTISGAVRDANTGQPLSGAIIGVGRDSTATFTDTKGFYQLTIPQGMYRLSVRYMGYQQQQDTIHLNRSIVRNYDLQPVNHTIDEVQVSTLRSGTALDDPQANAIHLSTKETKDVPVLFGEQDLLKAIQLLPGVQSEGEGSAHFTVRGGDAGQNLVLLDQATIYNPSHLLGFFSIFNPDAIKDIELYKGGIPAQFGGRIASVLDISMLEGNKKRFSGEGGLGVIASRFKVEGPIEQEKSSFLFSARRSYADSFLKLVKEDAMAGNKLYFYDLNAKLSFQLSKKTTLYLSGYHGRDELKYSDLFNLSWSNSTATARLKHRFNEKITSSSSLIYSRFKYNAGVSSEQTDFQLASNIENAEAKQDFSYYINDRHILRAGAALLLQRIQPANLSSDINQSVNPTAIERQRGADLGGYLLHEWKPTDRLSLNYGIYIHDFMVLGPRTFYQFDQTGKPIAEKRDESRIAKHYINLEPRMSASLVLDERRSLKTSYNRLVQNLHQLTNTSSSLPTDQYVLSSLSIKPQMVDQVSFGYFQKFTPRHYELSVEAYYKRLGNQIDVRNGATLQANSHFEGELLFGVGRAYGLETYLRKHSGRLTGWLSYTLSKSQRKFSGINAGRWFNARQDRSHDLAIVANYALSSAWTLGATFVFNTGNAVTFPSGKYLVNGRSMFYYTERNGYRMPDYHRLDFGVTYSPKKTNKGFRSSWTLGLYNVYNRKNAYTIDFRENKANPNLTEAYKIVLFGIVPSLTWNFKF